MVSDVALSNWIEETEKAQFKKLFMGTKGKSQTQVAEELGLKRQQVNNWVCGVSPIPAEKVIDWCVATGAHPEHVRPDLYIKPGGAGFGPWDKRKSLVMMQYIERWLEELETV